MQSGNWCRAAVTAAVTLTRVCLSLPETLPVPLRPPLSEPALAFVVALGASSSEEVELQLQDRMEFSKAAVSRVVEASDCLQRRVEELCQRVYSRGGFSVPHPELSITLCVSVMSLSVPSPAAASIPQAISQPCSGEGLGCRWGLWP